MVVRSLFCRVSFKHTLSSLANRGYDYAQSALLNKLWIVLFIPSKVNGFEITSSTAVLFLEKTASFPAPVIITTGVRGDFFLMLQAKATPSISGIS